MATKKQHPSEYLNDLEEWQNHQYDPGHYLGGNIPPQLKYGLGTKSGKYLGVVFLMLGVMSGVGVVFSFIEGTGNLFGLFLFVLFIITGLKLIIGGKR